MNSTIACVGLDVQNESDFEPMFDYMMSNAQLRAQRDDAMLVSWHDASGAGIMVSVNNGQIEDWFPAYFTSATTPVFEVTRISAELVRAVVRDEEGETVTMFAAQASQAVLMGEAAVEGPAHVTGLATEMEVFASEAEFDASPMSLLNPEEAGQPAPADWQADLPWPLRMGPEAFISMGLFGDPSEATAHARLHGRVLASETRTNAYTGQQFHVARVQTVGFQLDVCFAGTALATAPASGAIVAGIAYLIMDIPAAQ